MSFGYSVGDFLLLTQLAYRTVQNARKACGAHDDLAREVSSLHVVLQRVEVEVSKPESLLNKKEENRRKDLERLARHCERVLKVLDQILEKYNALPNEKRSVTKLWQKIRFGNGEMLDLGKIRSELATHTQALNMFLNLLSIGSQGKVEKYMDTHGEELREIKLSLHWVTASMQASSHEERSILTTYGEDDKAIWKAFRRELIEEVISSHVLDKHKRTIKKYVIELGERGALDEPMQRPGEEGRRSPALQLPGNPPSLSPSAAKSTMKTEETDKSTSDEYEDDPPNDQACPVPLFGSPLDKRPMHPEDNTNPDIGSGQVSLPKVPPHTIQYHHGRCSSIPPRTKVSPSEYNQHNRPSHKNPGSAFFARVDEVEEKDFADGAHPNCDDSENIEEGASITIPSPVISTQEKFSTIENIDPPRSTNEIDPKFVRSKPSFEHIDTYEKDYEGDDSSLDDSTSDESDIVANAHDQVSEGDGRHNVRPTEHTPSEIQYIGNSGIANPLERKIEYLMQQQIRRERYKDHCSHMPLDLTESGLCTGEFDWDTITCEDGRDQYEIPEDYQLEDFASKPDYLPAVAEAHHASDSRRLDSVQQNGWTRPNCSYHRKYFFCPERRQVEPDSVPTSSQESSQDVASEEEGVPATHVADSDPRKVDQYLIDIDAKIHSSLPAKSENCQPPVRPDGRKMEKMVLENRTPGAMTAWGSASERDEPEFRWRSRMPIGMDDPLLGPKEESLRMFWEALNKLDHKTLRVKLCLIIIKESKDSNSRTVKSLKKFIGSAQGLTGRIRQDVDLLRKQPRSSNSKTLNASEFRRRVTKGRQEISRRYYEEVLSMNQYFNAFIEPDLGGLEQSASGFEYLLINS